MGAPEVLEHAEHAAHAGGHGHEGHDDKSKFPMVVGITMATLGVLLAFAAAKVGGERTELISMLVEQQHAHAKYQAQDIKHRTAMLSLEQMHALVDLKPRGEDMLKLARTCERYLGEAEAAKEWVESFDPAIKAHAVGQEDYELAQLAAEIGIVIASIALLLRRKLPWFIALALGIAAVGIVAVTYVSTGKSVHSAEAKIEEAGKAYRELRTAGKTNAIDEALVKEIIAAYGGGEKKEGKEAPAPKE